MTIYGEHERSVSCRGERSERTRKLYLGDNLEIMPEMDDESVDLVYLDPPFNSNRNYKMVFRGPPGLRPKAHLPAFEDVWDWDEQAERHTDDLLGGKCGPRVARTVSGLIEVVGRDRLMAYLVNMTPRLDEIKRLLRSTGSVYLHCDPTASHYLKVIMDAVFGTDNFRNEIIWCYRGGGVPRRDFARKHDIILRYSKSKDYDFDPQYTEYSTASRELVEARGGVSIDDRERDLERGAHMPDWWADINSLQTWSPERTGYPKQKPLKLLERIVRSSSNEGDVVMDPFCGCGTTMLAAERLGRSWIGIDVESMALKVLRDRFKTAELDVGFEVFGLPSTCGSEDVVWEEMAESDPMKFEWAVIGQIDNCLPWRDQQDLGRGIDGVVTSATDNHENRHTIVRVRGGDSLAVSDLRELWSSVDDEGEHGVVGGVLVCGSQPSEELNNEARCAGTYQVGSQIYPRLRVITAGELFQLLRRGEALFPL